MLVAPHKTLARMHADAVQSEQGIACWKGLWRAQAMEMRDQPTQRPALNKLLFEVAEKGHRHGGRIKTLQHLLDLCASFS